MKIDQEIRLLKEQVRALSQRIEQRPVVQTIKIPSQMFLIIDQGNTLDSGQPGIKHLTTLLTSITAYDPNVTTSFVDGIGRARLVKDGVLQTDYVLVCNDVRSLWAASLLRDDTIAVAATTLISGVTVYVPI
jgi:hypothetical protein